MAVSIEKSLDLKLIQEVATFFVFAFVWLSLLNDHIYFLKNYKSFRVSQSISFFRLENEAPGYSLVTILYGLFLACGQEPIPYAGTLLACSLTFPAYT